MIVLIATCGRPELLKRTLDSLSDVIKPDCYAGTIIIENGSKKGIEELTEAYKEKLNISYMFTEMANKSNALNVAMKDITNTAIFFSDDDVLYDKNILTEYAVAAKEIDSGSFFGGSFTVDYEAEPSDFLKKYMPPSAVGSNWPNDMSEVSRPIFLGSNWLAFADDIKLVGGFDPNFGPGSATNSTGQETNMQKRLLRKGFKGRYVPGAKVKHFVPAERSTPEWTIKRIHRVGISYGLSNQFSKYELSIMRMKTIICPFCRIIPFISYETKFKIDYYGSFYRGQFQGRKLLRKQQC
ncbi:MAG: glycosyltransferase [Chlorobi bacterium]|nr:glycosyltransferase [Chlorobiota bacterium]